MTEIPRSREEKIEDINKILMDRRTIRFSWNGYPVTLGTYGTYGIYRIGVDVIVTEEEVTFLAIFLDGNMDPIGMNYFSLQKEGFYKLDTNDLPGELRNPGAKIVEFVLNQDLDALGELDGWVL